MTVNELAHVEGAWVDDGGGGEMEHEGVGDTVVTLKSAKRGTPANARYNAPAVGQWYFEVILVHVMPGSSVSVGIVNPDEFQPGWKTTGMFYNGNLTNGHAALLTNFGPRLQEGDTIGVYVTNDNRNVTFFYNGRCLGTGFQLADEDSKFYCPCLHVDGTVQISFAVPETMPSSVEAEIETWEGWEGDWKLVSAIDEEGSPVVVPDKDMVLSLHHSGEKTYTLVMRVANTMRAQLIVEDDGSVKIGPIMSTMMMPFPPFEVIEPFLSSSFPKVQSVKLGDGGLVLSSETSPLKLTYERHHETFKPLEKYK